MSKSTIIIATAESNSLDDDYGRVKISAKSIWDSYGPVMVSGSIPLTKGEKVFVDVSSGYMNPVVIGRYQGKYNGDSLLFESSDGSSYTRAIVNKNKITLSNSDNVEIVIEGKNVKINLPTGGQFSVGGTNLTVDA